jgi:hypothetical protein
MKSEEVQIKNLSENDKMKIIKLYLHEKKVEDEYRMINEKMQFFDNFEKISGASIIPTQTGGYFGENKRFRCFNVIYNNYFTFDFTLIATKDSCDINIYDKDKYIKFININNDKDEFERFKKYIIDYSEELINYFKYMRSNTDAYYLSDLRCALIELKKSSYSIFFTSTGKIILSKSKSPFNYDLSRQIGTYDSINDLMKNNQYLRKSSCVIS